MPYALPPPTSSPVLTMTMSAPLLPATLPSLSPVIAAAASPRAEQKRPPRHHQRSHSSDATPTSSSFIFVQPASPDEKGAAGRSRSYMWAAGTSHASTSGSTSPSSPGPSFNTVPRSARRIRLTALTPSAPDLASPRREDGSVSPGGPSSQEEASSSDTGARAVRPAEPPSASTLTAPEDRTPRAADPIFRNAFPFGEPSSSSSSAVPSPTPADDMITAKPALMVRKKSGELVRPSLKADTSRRDFSQARSAPATPVCPKYVHFDTQLEHVKHFLAQQRPAAVSRSGSPIETETEDEPEAFPFPAMVQPQAGVVQLVLPNFPPAAARADEDAYVESLDMTSDGKSIRGIVHVRNLAFEKWVAVRFTLDHWQTVSEVSAEHHESLPGGQADRFAFTIRLQDLLARIEEKTMFLAVRYTVGGREIWDNNGGQNYRIEFKRVPAAPQPPVHPAVRSSASTSHAPVGRIGADAALAAAQQRKAAWSVTNAGQAADRMADLRRELDRLVRDDTFDDDDDDHRAGGLSSASAASGGPRSLRLALDGRSFSETSVPSPTSLSGRYDFGNSLKMYSSPNASAVANGAATASTSHSGGPAAALASVLGTAGAGAGRGGYGAVNGQRAGAGRMKERNASSPRFAEGSLPHPSTAKPFFDPVSTSPQRPRAPPLPHVSAPPSYGSTQIINGHPATMFDPSLAPPINSHRGDSPKGSPRLDMQPDFGLPSRSSVPGDGRQQSAALYSPTFPTPVPRPMSPPQSQDGSSLGLSSYFYGPPGSNVGGLPYLPLQDATTHQGFGNAHSRYNTYPAGGKANGPASPRSTSFSPLVPPAFRDSRSRLSPFSSPAPSPPTGVSPTSSPPRSTSPLPQTTTRKLRSPPPERVDTSDEDPSPSQLWSPSTTDSTASTISSSSSGSTARGHLRRDGSGSSATSSLLSSPESDATSVAPESPGFSPSLYGMSASAQPAGKAAPLARPGNAHEFSAFLDRYRFHLGSSASPTSMSSTSPVQPDFFTYAAASSPRSIPGSHSPSQSSSEASSNANSPTPRQFSPLSVAVAAAASAAPAANGTTTLVS
ncbi:CBM21 domain-containing protein [Rhodotorula paludigena]|uniref:CBM21 domain-containing protein n=1 Tax=Rhodotorula paludigena TaxID=86838 RepID=UPI00317D95D0